MDWLMSIVGPNIDPKQFGGLKGNSTSHYLIELVSYVLFNQDFKDPIAILMCAVDFSKAFNRIDHNKVLEILSDMGVPGWLLNIVCGFLMNRSMVVSYKGKTSKSQQMPGGGPQGTLLGLLLFLVLINSCCEFDRNLSVGSSQTVARSNWLIGCLGSLTILT